MKKLLTLAMLLVFAGSMVFAETVTALTILPVSNNTNDTQNLQENALNKVGEFQNAEDDLFNSVTSVALTDVEQSNIKGGITLLGAIVGGALIGAGLFLLGVNVMIFF